MNAGIDFLEFKPSEIAAAVAISVSGEDEQAQNIDKAISCFIHVEKVNLKFWLDPTRNKTSDICYDDEMGFSFSCRKEC